ncbi:5941_t:CDS:2 [Racocetra fulgida]|uniref:5941_t:CDS:1 n=1 Tax=Racocetra fulgida TaxID=60492 RepID=A0A9N8YXL3_9GLOM|nr:5941_t:CDS:2 [Racocetra fulgida]
MKSLALDIITILLKRKNHAGSIKDSYAEAGFSFIPPDISGNTYTPYLPFKLEKGSHDIMMNAICKDAKLDFKALKDSTSINNNQVGNIDIYIDI